MRPARTASAWTTPARQPPLPAGGVQVWRLQTAALAESAWSQARAVLSGEEQARALRMRAGLAREEFVVARGLLRLLLGGLLGQAGAAVQFRVGEQGKPATAQGGDLHFNVSHARGCVLVALSRAGPIGVDVEYVDRNVEALELAQAHFHPAEIAAIEATPPGELRQAIFFRCWTRKEALVKADGRGLQVPLEMFNVLPAEEASRPMPDLEVALERGASPLYLVDLAPAPGYQGAMAVQHAGTMAGLFSVNVKFPIFLHPG